MPSKSVYACIAFAVAGWLFGCTKQKSTMFSDTQIRAAIPANILIILAKRPDLQSNILTLQDFIRGGKSFIPVFRSKESFKEATQGKVAKPTYQIDRRLFVSMLHGPEIVILDPGMPGEIVTTGDTIKRVFPEPFDPQHSTPVR